MMRAYVRRPLFFLLFGVCAGLPFAGAAEDFGARSTTMWRPAEWRVENPSHQGNPFDVLATATFTHELTGRTRVTELFYAGDATWAWRFTGTLEGRWTFLTESGDPELDGHTGSVEVAPNPDPSIHGFLTHAGNRFAIQQDNEDDLHAYFFHVYMNQNIVHTNFEAFRNKATVDAYLEDAQENGFDVVFTSLNNNWLKLGTLRHDAHESVNPDLETFAILDRIIQEAHRRGMRWHFWAWGDEARRWTPLGLPGGANGEVDRRLQRYIAARLGPLPGWSLGYGFDLIEWTDDSMRNGWASYLHQKMGWDHLLSTRGFQLEGTRNNMTSYSGFGGRDLTTSRHGPADFAEVCRHIDADPKRPSFYEERHSYKREGFQLDMTGTRRLRWWQAMAGGLGGFYGFYDSSPHPYPAPEQLRTFQRFWQGRFTLDLERAEGLSDGRALLSTDGKRLVLYKEDAGAIRADLSNLKGSMRAIAVDAAAAYDAVDLGALPRGETTLELPWHSDWAVAIGDFGRK